MERSNKNDVQTGNLSDVKRSMAGAPCDEGEGGGRKGTSVDGDGREPNGHASSGATRLTKETIRPK